jgi:acyl carrier protein
VKSEEVLKDIMGFMTDFLDIPNLRSDDDLFRDINLDSIQVLGLLTFIEQRFGVKIAGDSVSRSQMATPVRIAELVLSRRT